MSFRDLDGGARHQPKQRSKVEEDAYERAVRTGVQELQDAVRRAAAQLEQARRGRPSKRSAEALDRLLERAEELSEATARQVRDWTVHLAGEPAERHRKKFSLEKLQKAFDEEVSQLKDLARRAVPVKQEALANSSSLKAAGAPGSARECRSMVEEQDALEAGPGDLEGGLLDDSDIAIMAQEDSSSIRILEAVAHEREEGIRRVANQFTEVNQMLRDMASIVQEQGHQFQSIEREAESAATNTKQAVQELRKAVDRQRGMRERLCCMLAVAAFLLCFIILPHMHSMHPRLEVPSPSGEELTAPLQRPLVLGTRRQPPHVSGPAALT